MDVLRLMTTDASARRVTKLLTSVMAARAGDSSVRIVQRKVTEVVIEPARIEGDDLPITPLVLLMAGTTRARNGDWIATVKTLAVDTIRLHVGVTGAAERRLRLAAGGLMTARTIVFDRRVRLDHEPGHHETLKAEALRTRLRAPRQHGGRRNKQQQRYRYMIHRAPH
jgi:hypothetical protein